MFLHSTLEAAGTNPDSCTVSLDLPGLFKHPLKRIDQHFAKAAQHHDTAEHYRRRAGALESNRAIFSDDPDATEKLVDKIERLKKRHGVMKRANLLIRKADRDGLADLGFCDETIAKLFKADFA